MGLFLGNKLVSPAELIKEGGSSSKFGLTIDSFIGNMDGNGVLSAPSSINGITFTGVTEIGYRALKCMFYESDRIFGLVAFPDLTTVGSQGLYHAFNSNQITSVDLSSLTTVGDYGLYHAFQYCQITSVDLSSLTTVGDSGVSMAFFGNQITSVDLSSLTTVGNDGLNGTFSYNQLTSVDLSSLTTVGYNGLQSAFSSNIDPDTQQTTLQTVSFPALTSNSFKSSGESAFYNMLESDDGVTVHFPSNLQSVISDWDDVKNGFSGTNTTVLFDLPATE